MHHADYIIKMNFIYYRYISVRTSTHLYVSGYETPVAAYLKRNRNILRNILILINPRKK